MAAKKPITSSERRGVILLAILSLIVTFAGFFISRCDSGKPHATQEDIRIIMDQELQNESSSKSDKNSSKKSKNNKNVKKSRSGSSKNKTKKTYRRRNPNDEPV